MNLLINESNVFILYNIFAHRRIICYTSKFLRGVEIESMKRIFILFIVVILDITAASKIKLLCI